MEVVYFATPEELRAWLEANHAKATELWVGFYKKDTGRPSITWPESVDEALCFGWIDGVRKRIDAERYMIRFSPRKPRSVWSLVNIRRIEELLREGRVRPAGLAAFEKRDEKRSGIYQYEQRRRGLDEAYLAQIQANPAAWEYFQAQPAAYRRNAAAWIMSAKKEETRQRRLASLINESEQGRPVPALTMSKKRD